MDKAIFHSLHGHHHLRACGDIDVQKEKLQTCGQYFESLYNNTPVGFEGTLLHKYTFTSNESNTSQKPGRRAILCFDMI